MDKVVAYKIVQHNYDETFLENVFSVGELKRKEFEWNMEQYANSPIREELKKYDYVYSIQNINNLRDEFGYCFFNETKLKDGNFLYSFEGIILDNRLPEKIIKNFISEIVSFLCQYHRDELVDTYRINRITGIGSEPYPLAPHFINRTEEAISPIIYKMFIASRDGLVPLPNELKKHLDEIVKIMEKSH